MKRYLIEDTPAGDFPHLRRHIVVLQINEDNDVFIYEMEQDRDTGGWLPVYDQIVTQLSWQSWSRFCAFIRGEGELPEAPEGAV